MQTIIKEKTYRNFINNEWIDSASQTLIKSINPADKEEIVGYVQNSNKVDLENAVKAAHQAKKSWRKLGQAARGQLLFK
ncbi:MAG: aldehyde dehydrogenase family protein, partial [Bacillus sp. (in: firmicutes)]